MELLQAMASMTEYPLLATFPFLVLTGLYLVDQTTFYSHCRPMLGFLYSVRIWDEMALALQR